MPDQPALAETARHFLSTLGPEQPGFVSSLTLCEVVWTLGRAYGYARGDVVRVVEGLQRSALLVLERPDLVDAALASFRTGGPGFSDHFIAATHAAAGVSASVTLDRRASKLPGWRLLAASG